MSVVSEQTEITRDQRTFAQAIAAALADGGVRHAFGLMGSGNMRVLHHLEHDHGVTFHPARHETVAVGSADGYARATGEVGICLVTQGPGFTNALTGLITARRANTPLVLVTGDSSAIRTLEDPFSKVQAIPTAAFLEAADVAMVAAHPQSAERDVHEALSRAAGECRPVGLVMPYEHEIALVPGDGAAPRSPSAQRVAAPLAAVAAAAERLRSARMPLILAGRGAVRSGAGPVLRELADELGAVLGTTLPASGLFHGHPGYLGIVGGFSSPPVRDALAQIDCALVVGAGLNGFTVRSGTLLEHADVIQVDVDPDAFGRHRPGGTGVLGDARTTGEALLEAVRARRGERSSVRREPAVARALAGPRTHAYDDTSTDGVLDPRALCERLDALLPTDRAVVTDGGRFAAFVMQQMQVTSPDALMYMLEFGAVGGGVGAALGAAIGRPERLTVLFAGDSGVMMTLGDFDLAVRERIALLVVCMNDEALGSEIQLLRAAGLAEESAHVATPELADVFHAMGADALRIGSVDELDAIADRLGALDGPLFLDCRVSRDVVWTP